MRKTVVTLALLSLAGCSGGAQDAAPDETPALSSTAPAPTPSSTEATPSQSGTQASTGTSAAPTPGASTSPDSPRDAEGTIEKDLGEDFFFPPDDPAVRMSIDEVDVDPRCTGDAPEEPENGHFLALDVRVSTGPDLDEAVPGFSVSPGEFTVIGADQTTRGGLDTFAAFSCIDSSDTGLPDVFRASRKYAGTIVLDSPYTEGTLLYQPYFADDALRVDF